MRSLVVSQGEGDENLQLGDGLEIHNMLRNYSGKVRVTMAGYCMSIATYIALAANEVVVEDNAVYMIHNVHGGIWGDHNDILHYGEMCKGLSSMLTRAYAKFTDKGVDDLAKLMDATTYYYGDEIVDQGFAQEEKGSCLSLLYVLFLRQPNSGQDYPLPLNVCVPRQCRIRPTYVVVA